MGIYLTSKLSCCDHFWNEFWGELLRETQFIKGFQLAKNENPGRNLRLGRVLVLVHFQFKAKFRLSRSLEV